MASQMDGGIVRRSSSAVGGSVAGATIATMPRKPGIQVARLDLTQRRLSSTMICAPFKASIAAFRVLSLSMAAPTSTSPTMIEM